MCTILVVEDERLIRELTRMLLEGRGYQVLPAGDGREALFVLEEKIDLVLTDNMMPRLDGIGLCRELRERFGEASIPIILMSAGREPVEHRELYDAFAQKPFTIDGLVNVVEQFLSHRRSPQES